MGSEPLIVADTHALVWWLADPARLSAKARRSLDAASVDSVIVCAATLLELATLLRRGRLSLSVPADTWLADLGRIAEVRVEPVTGPIAIRAGSFTEQVPGDPIDRLIVATAMSLGVPLVTADTRLSGISGLRTIW
jgi:PIN domain nuclease of toxin-antitoxin system